MSHATDSSAARSLRVARELDRAGKWPAAIEAYGTAHVEADRTGEKGVAAEALRRLAVVHHRLGQHDDAMALCRDSITLAESINAVELAAEGLNALAGLELEQGNIEAAWDTFQLAAGRGSASHALRGRIEQNLGIVANIRGDYGAALTHYHSSLSAFTAARDDTGRAIAFHNLGMISADQAEWDRADLYFRASLELAESLGDVPLQALCLLNHTEVLIARQQYGEAKQSAEAALRAADELGAPAQKADAYRFIGRIYRETGRLVLADARLSAAIELARASGTVLGEAEATRELARLCQDQGRTRDALRHLTAARRLFARLGASGDTREAAAKIAELESAYLAVVRDWGQSIESADTYTFGHCERVATYAVAVAAELGLDADDRTAIRVGAYLHDVGKVRVPHEILNKPGRLTSEERECIELHPIYGVEMLEGVDFPWEVTPMIRWHHERFDGSGYPDRLRGDAVPVAAQIIGLVDVYDALTSTRSYRAAMSHDDALTEIARTPHLWRDDVYAAFCSAMTRIDIGAAEPVANSSPDA